MANRVLLALALVAVALCTSTVYSDVTGSFSLESYEYVNNMDKSWVIDVWPTPDTIELTIDGTTESYYDRVYVYQAMCSSSGQVYSGTSTQVGEYMSGYIDSTIKIDLYSGYDCVVVRFTSDSSSYGYAGFDVEYCTDDYCPTSYVGVIVAIVFFVIIVLICVCCCKACCGKKQVVQQPNTVVVSNQMRTQPQAMPQAMPQTMQPQMMMQPQVTAVVGGQPGMYNAYPPAPMAPVNQGPI
eukprot:g11847.t1